MERKNFVFYRNWMEAIKDLSPGEREDILIAIIDYGLDGTLPENLKMVDKIIFEMAKPQIDKNNTRYTNGHLGGGQKGNQNARKKRPKTTKNDQTFFSETNSNNYKIGEGDKNNSENDLHKKTTKNDQKQPNVVLNNQQSEININNEVDNEDINDITKRPKTTKNDQTFFSETNSNNNGFDNSNENIIKNDLPQKNDQKRPKNNQNFSDVTHSNNSEFGEDFKNNLPEENQPNDNDNTVMEKRKEKEPKRKEYNIYKTTVFSGMEKNNIYKTTVSSGLVTGENFSEKNSESNYSKLLTWMKTHTPSILKNGMSVITEDEMTLFISSNGKGVFFRLVKELENWIAKGGKPTMSMYDTLNYAVEQEKKPKEKVKLSNSVPFITDIIDEDTSQWSDEEYLDRLYPHLKPNNPFHLTKERLEQQQSERDEIRNLLHSMSLRKEGDDFSNHPKREYLKYRGCVEIVRQYYNEQLEKYGNYMRRWDNIDPIQLDYMQERLMISGLDDVKNAIDLFAQSSLLSESAKIDGGGEGIDWLLSPKKYSELKKGVYNDPKKFPPLKPIKEKSEDV